MLYLGGPQPLGQYQQGRIKWTRGPGQSRDRDNAERNFFSHALV